MLESKERIIHATIRLVYEIGIEKTATGKISKASEVATGTLFHHYPSKKILFESIHQYVLDDYLFHLMGFFDYPDDQIGRQLKKAIKASIDYWVRNPAYFSFINQMRHSGFYSQEIYQKEEELIERQLGKAFQQVINQGVVGTYDYKVLLRILLKTIFEMADMILMAETEEMKSKYRDQGVTFIWAALSPGKN